MPTRSASPAFPRGRLVRLRPTAPDDEVRSLAGHAPGRPIRCSTWSGREAMLRVVFTWEGK